MSPEKFKRLYFGGFWTRPRDVELYNRLEQYYRDTESLGERAAKKLQKDFSDWRLREGYTNEEYVKAKRNYERRN